jgi:hypothetical protein
MRVFNSLSVISMTSLATKAPSLSSQFLDNRRPSVQDKILRLGADALDFQLRGKQFSLGGEMT